MKRYCVLALGAFLVVNLLAACDTRTPDPTVRHYADLLKQEGATLNLYWPANGTIKTWLTQTLIPDYQKFMQEKYGVTIKVNVLPTIGGDELLHTNLGKYEQANNHTAHAFSVDIARVVPASMWIDAARAGWLLPVLTNSYGFALPNIEYVNQQGRAIFTLNGDEKTLYAVPFYQPTISFFYNKNRINQAELPQTLDDLLAWAKKHPRRFTYENPSVPSSIGSGIMFLLAVMHAKGDSESTGTTDGFQYLKALQPYIYPEPRDPDGLRNLMAHDDIWLMPYWNNDGLSEAQTYHISFMLNYFPVDKMPVRNTPLIIPRSAQHTLAALIFMNYALSNEAQRMMAMQIRQFPANTNDAVLHNLPAGTFGYNINDITNDMFPSYNSEVNLKWIQSLLEQYPREVL